MTDQYRDPDTAISGGNDLSDSIRGLQSVVSRKENERQAALSEAAEARADAQQARAELEEARTLLETERDPYMDPNKAPRQRHESPSPIDALKGASWEEFPELDAARHPR